MDSIVDNLDHNHLYGPIGAIVNGDHKISYGQIFQGIEGHVIQYGNPIEKPTLVDTVDCQCLFFYTDLLGKYSLRFDENILLSFHQYVEEFCLNASCSFGIDTFAVPMRCKHLSWGKIDDDFNLALNYINSKYPQKQWAGTCTHLKKKTIRAGNSF